MEHKEISIVECIFVKELIYYIELSNGDKGLVDFSPLASKHQLFNQILSEDRGINYYLDGYTIEWYNGADIAPEWVQEHLLPRCA
ncbi:hypothetical protein PDPUS_4_00003 (plasmid) [Photobacterium damselae subsp. piscicida]|uniref:Protein of uncharacterized function (DUF2442) n=2 Tax=Photobacterium damselae TaxID=38293 RepID=A0A2T3Q310_PHODM|nr:DUF2442 domain-containing protein [Photobacterium damselae]MDP2514985.1 DUF2442 domain-containing protein [Photobacterium damselae subsp. piscicida]MDP2531476.1 DUF2442 domain-containing protein [Photobacterium damselae subsp. piscicida]MDP2543430.1 DUF2442 domain-containing protein [Photobacterium damselae subsp. piscicida]MDP2558482.1 DUF2442 domain-containing protein [Photobacterium damselae subsp. piscicida]MDP2567252.1 DUF2442 domain-containing protein [Photobacterium damselae subsp. p